MAHTNPRMPGEFLATHETPSFDSIVDKISQLAEFSKKSERNYPTIKRMITELEDSLGEAILLSFKVSQRKIDTVHVTEGQMDNAIALAKVDSALFKQQQQREIERLRQTAAETAKKLLAKERASPVAKTHLSKITQPWRGTDTTEKDACTSRAYNPKGTHGWDWDPAARIHDKYSKTPSVEQKTTQQAIQNSWIQDKHGKKPTTENNSMQSNIERYTIQQAANRRINENSPSTRYPMASDFLSRQNSSQRVEILRLKTQVLELQEQNKKLVEQNEAVAAMLKDQDGLALTKQCSNLPKSQRGGFEEVDLGIVEAGYEIVYLD